MPGLVARKGSHYAAALEDDDDLAELLLGGKGQGGVYRPSLTDWGRIDDGIADIKDLLTIAVFKGSGKTPQFTSRPERAVDRVKRKRITSKQSVVLSQLLPHEK